MGRRPSSLLGQHPSGHSHTVLAPFTNEEGEGTLTLSAGDEVWVSVKGDEWWYVQAEATEGWCPVQFLVPSKELPDIDNDAGENDSSGGGGGGGDKVDAGTDAAPDGAPAGLSAAAGAGAGAGAGAARGFGAVGGGRAAGFEGAGAGGSSAACPISAAVMVDGGTA